MNILGERLEQFLAEIDARKRAHLRNGGVRQGAYAGPREDATPTNTLPLIRLSDPRSRRPTCGRGCLTGPDEDRYVCVTHGTTLAWVRP